MLLLGGRRIGRRGRGGRRRGADGGAGRGRLDEALPGILHGLVDALDAWAPSAHLVHVSIVGCFENPYPYYRAKADAEAKTAEEADLVILNTCHIRERATEKVYSDIGRVRKHARAEGREPMIAVAGCVAQAEGEEIVARAVHASQVPLVDAVRAAKLRGERVVMTNGCFDILHAGHVAYLEQAKRLGDRLVVAVNDDASIGRLKGPKRPINPLNRRMQVLAGLGAVDWVVPFSDDTPAALIEQVLPDILVKGGDYRPEDIAGGSAVIANGGEVKVLGFEDGVSTTAMISSILDRES